MTPEQLIAFEDDIAAEFAAGHVRAPVHLNGGNERQIIEAFDDIRRDDYVFSAWRSHYAALLRGVPPDVLKAAIMRGRSINLSFPEYRFFTSAIVGGICPIAAGVAWAIKRRKGREKVHCFIGDMTSFTGIYQECRRYCVGHSLPVRWIIEDNGVSVCTQTDEAWGRVKEFPNVKVINYKLTKPHVGVGTWVQF